MFDKVSSMPKYITLELKVGIIGKQCDQEKFPRCL